MLECADIEGAGSGPRVPVELEHNPRVDEVGAGIDEQRSLGRVNVAYARVDKDRVRLEPVLLGTEVQGPLAKRLIERCGRPPAYFSGTASAKPIVKVEDHATVPHIEVAVFDDGDAWEISEHIVLDHNVRYRHAGGHPMIRANPPFPVAYAGRTPSRRGPVRREP